MGFLSGDETTSEADQLLSEQIQENKAELERKKQDLYKTRLDIIKSQGGQQWSPDMGGGARDTAQGLANRQAEAVSKLTKAMRGR